MNDGFRGRTELRERVRLSMQDYVVALSVAQDGKLAAAAVGDGRVVGFDPQTGTTSFSVQAHRHGALGVAVSPDGTHVASCGQDGHARLWTAQGALVSEMPGTAGWVEHVAWGPRGQLLATASGRTLRVWTRNGELRFESGALASTLTGLAWRGDEASIAASCYGGVHVFPLVEHAKARHLSWKGSLVSIAWSPDGKVLACGSQDGSVHFWRLSSGRDSEMTGYPSKPRSLAWSSDSKMLATAGDATVTVWGFRGKGPEGTAPIQLSAHHALCSQLTWNPRTEVLASGSQDTSVLLWAPRRGVRPTGYAFLEDEVTALAWLPDGRALLGADASGTICTWET